MKSASWIPRMPRLHGGNFGISLYNANRLGDAVEPLQKSAELDPRIRQTWYLLGASLVYKMTTKKVGDRESRCSSHRERLRLSEGRRADPMTVGPAGQARARALELMSRDRHHSQREEKEVLSNSKQMVRGRFRTGGAGLFH